MSTYVFLHCFDDEQNSGSANHGEYQLADLLKSRSAVDAIYDSEIWGRSTIELEGFWDGGYEEDDIADPLRFLAHHKGHHVGIRDEYGYEYTDEGERREDAVNGE